MTFIYLKESRITIGFILTVLIVVGYFAYQSWQKFAEENDQNPAKLALTADSETEGYTDIEGNRVNLVDYLGRVIVVNSWASWSPFSSQELTTLDALANQYSEGEVVFLAINRMEPPSTAERYINQFSKTESINLLLDPTDKFYQSIGGYSMPETVIYNQEGDIYHHYRGGFKSDDLSAKIEHLIKIN